jgi:DNA-binding LacI/PurR family transcriptional regulator
VLASLGIPHALIGRPADAAGLNWVDIDFDLTVAGALEHLVSHGHRTVALVNQPAAMHRSGYGPAVRILDCFDLHCARLGLAGASAFCERDAPAGRDTIREVLDGWPQSTAVLVMNDQALPGVIHGIRETGRRIPEDLSLIALLCPEATARHFWPPLSAMEIPSQALGRLGMNRLIDQLEAGGSPAVAEPTLMPCTWSERGTSAPAPAIPSMPMAPHRGNTPVVRGPAKKTTGRSRGEGLGQP